MTRTRGSLLGGVLLACVPAIATVPQARAALPPMAGGIATAAADTVPVDFSAVSLTAISSPTGQDFSYTPVSGAPGTVNVRLLRGAVMSVQPGNQPDLSGLYVLSGAPDSVSLRLTFDRAVLFDVVDNETMTAQEIATLTKGPAFGDWDVVSEEYCIVGPVDTTFQAQGMNDSEPYGHYHCRASADRFDWSIINIPGFYSVLGSAISLRVLGDPVTTAVGPAAPAGDGPRMALWPNPGTGGINVRFSSPTPATGVLDVFDATGRKVCTLFSGAVGPEARVVRWDERGEDGRKAAAGHYWIRFGTGERSSRLPVTVIR